MRKWIIVLMALAWTFSCQENPTKDNTEKELQVDESVAEQAALGYQVNQYVATGDEIEMMTSGFDNPDINSGFGVMNSQTQSSNRAIARFNRIKGYIKDVQTLQKVQGEVPLFYEDSVNENGDKYRSAALVDAVNGTMRFYYVIYEFASRNVNGRNVTLNMTYDSTEIKFTFSGQNFENLEPQQIFAIQLFKPDYLVQSTTTVMDITSFTNDEVQSFASKTTSVYNSSRLDSTVALLNFQIDGTSTVTQTFYFDDGTSRTSTITFNIDGTGSFSRTLRSGVTVSGTFNQVKDDGNGSYEATWTFPAESYLKTIFRSAAVSADSVAGYFHSNFFERIDFASGDVDSVRINFTKDFFNNITTLNVTRRNGAYGSFTMEEQDQLSVLTGYWVTHDSFYVDVRAEYYQDGSSYLYYAVYQNRASFENGDDPILVAEYNFAPDGSGEGVVRKDGETYEVTLDDGGVGQITLNGAKAQFNMYQ